MGNTPRRKSRAGTRTAPPSSRSAAGKAAGSPWPRRLTFVAGAAVVAIILAGVFLGGGDEDLPEGAPEGVRVVDVGDFSHVEGDIEYDAAVPAGGLHNSELQPCAFYDGYVRPENVLHALEHGAVWLSYRRDLGEDAIDSLRALTGPRRPQLLVSEMPDQPAPLIATSWGRQLELDAYDDTIVRQFIREFTDGPGTPEPGATC